jgi:hypothetical protein
VLLLDGRELIEEGVGFGVPVAKYADKTFFPGSAKVVVKNDSTFTKIYILDTVSVKRFGQASYIDDDLYSPLRKTFQLLYLRHKRLNGFFNKLMELRDLANIKTDFIKVKPRGEVAITYQCNQTGIKVAADFSKLNLNTCKELLLLNEQGASMFQVYKDTSGITASGTKIGGWEEVNAVQAWLQSPKGSVSFIIPKKPEARLYRGWEHTNNRFSWAGLSYSIPPKKEPFNYTVTIHCKNRRFTSSHDAKNAS